MRSGSATGSGCRRRRRPGRRSFLICSRHTLERPLALGMCADDPVARVSLHRPSFRIEAVDERRDRRRTKIRDEADRTDARRLKLGECLPERLGVRPLEDRDIVSTQLGSSAGRSASAPSHIVFVADGEDALTGRQAQSLPDGLGTRTVQELEGHRPRSRMC